MERVLCDTNVLSEAMLPPNRRGLTFERNLRTYLRSQGRLTFSEISSYEILRGLYHKGAVRQLANFREFVRRSELLPVTFAVLERAAELWSTGRRQGMLVDDSDLIVAAMSLIERLPVVTANQKHFVWIGGLEVTTWHAD